MAFFFWVQLASIAVDNIQDRSVAGVRYGATGLKGGRPIAWIGRQGDADLNMEGEGGRDVNEMTESRVTREGEEGPGLYGVELAVEVPSGERQSSEDAPHSSRLSLSSLSQRSKALSKS